MDLSGLVWHRKGLGSHVGSIQKENLPSQLRDPVFGEFVEEIGKNGLARVGPRPNP